MSWRDNLRSASFRDIPFKVMSVTTEGGRRAVLHQMPFKDLPFVEDLGRIAGVYNVVGYVVQSAGNSYDYFTERESLKDALDRSGAATLVHPFYGEIEVNLTGKYRIDESFAEGGLARFQMTFTEAGAIEYPVAVADPVGWITSLADSLISGAGDFFEEAFDPTGPNFLTDAAGAAKDLSVGLKMVRSSLYGVQATAVAEISAVLTVAADIYGTVADIINSPAAIVNAVKETFATYASLIPFVDADRDFGESLVNATLKGMDYGKDDADQDDGALDNIPETTPSREQQVANREAMVTLIRIHAFAEALRASVNVEYKSYDQAYAALVKLADHADDLLKYVAGGADQDDMYNQVREAKPKFVKTLLEAGASLPLVVSYTVPTDPFSSLHVAFAKYGTIDREQEIVDRNPERMLHPGFPGGGEAVEVLSE